MKKIWMLALAVALAVTGFFVFSAKNDNGDSLQNYAGTLVVGISNDVDTFNPLFSESVTGQEVNHLLLLGLADLDDRSEFVPELAKSWKSSEDHLELTYYLREDATWSDGVPISAEDVKFTWDLLMDSTLASPRQGVTEFVRRVVVKDPHTVTFEFSKPYPDQLFDTAGEILPKHILGQVNVSNLQAHEFGRHPISSGPFVLKNWVSHQYIELAPNERYFGGRPYLDRVVFKVVPDKTNLLLQLQTGEVDMMVGVPPAEVGRVQQANPNIAIYPTSGRLYYYIGYDLESPLFSDRKVREALTQAVDIQKIIDALLYGYGEPCLGPLPPMVKWAYNDDVERIAYSPEDARSKLKQEGWVDHDGDGWVDKDGKSFEFTLKTNTGNQLRSDVAVILQDQLKKIGIRVNIQTLEFAALMDDLRKGQFDAYMGGWNTSFNVDLTPIFHSKSADFFNFVKYANPQVDHLIELGREEMDHTKAATIWKQAHELIYQDQPYTFLFWIDRIVAVDKRFKNVHPIPLSALYDLEKWYVDLGGTD